MALLDYHVRFLDQWLDARYLDVTDSAVEKPCFGWSGKLSVWVWMAADACNFWDRMAGPVPYSGT
jgi:hypothetical protein